MSFVKRQGRRRIKKNSDKRHFRPALEPLEGRELPGVAALAGGDAP